MADDITPTDSAAIAAAVLTCHWWPDQQCATAGQIAALNRNAFWAEADALIL